MQEKISNTRDIMKNKFIRLSFALFLIFGTSIVFAQNTDAII